MRKLKITLVTLIVGAVMAINTTATAQQAGDIDTTWADSGWLIGGHVLSDGVDFRKIKKISNNRFVLVGESYNPDSDILMVMYNADGTLYTDFANNGVLRIDVSLGDHDSGFDFVELWDGKFLITGTSTTAQSVDLVVLRITADGEQDYSFGTNGIVRFSGTPGNVSVPVSIAVSSSNNIFVSAKTNTGGGTMDMSVIKFTQGGGADLTYGDNGFATVAMPNSIVELRGMHLTADEEAIIIGSVNTNSGRTALMMKLDASGDLISDWADGGYFSYSPSNINYFSDIHVDAMGSIFVVGYHGEGDYNRNGFIRKFGTNGMPDNSFGTNGKITMDIGADNGLYYNNIKMKADGNYIVTGKAFGHSLKQIHAFTFDASGSADCEFSCSGVYHDIFVDEVNYMSQTLLEIMDDGSVITGGYVTSPAFTGKKVFLVKLLSEAQIVSVYNHEAENLQLLLYPNPTSSEIYIKNVENLAIIQLSLFALDGRVVQQWNGSRNSYPINQVVSNGNYIARIVSNKGVSSQLITISK